MLGAHRAVPSPKKHVMSTPSPGRTLNSQTNMAPTVLSILTRLEATSSRLEKEAILNQNSGNADLKQAFQLALDPMVNFYIKKVPEAYPPPPGNTGYRSNLQTAFTSMVTHLARRKVRGNDASEWLAQLLGMLAPDDQEVVRRVIGRNLKCGVSDATVEKTWSDLKLSYPCMLVSPMDAKTKLKFPCIAQTKMDGMRFNALVEGGKVTYRSRAGKELELFGVLDADVLSLTASENFVLDGELLVCGTDGRPLDRKTGNGLLTKFQKGTGTRQLSTQIRAVVWDIIPLECFRKGSCAIGYYDRWRMLVTEKPGRVQVAPIHNVNSMEEAQVLYKQKLAEGEEGLVLKDPAGPWEDKRVKHQVKMKAELEADLMITGFLPGSGKYEGKIGSLLAESADGQVKTAVGTGLSDADRALPPSEYIGKVAAIKYNAVITDKKTGERSLFLPVFIELRDDKTVADSI
jgi:ATP dependent DNA ligase domain/DNA ligase OB-like domain